MGTAVAPTRVHEWNRRRKRTTCRVSWALEVVEAGGLASQETLDVRKVCTRRLGPDSAARNEARLWWPRRRCVPKGASRPRADASTGRAGRPPRHSINQDARQIPRGPLWPSITSRTPPHPRCTRMAPKILDAQTAEMSSKIPRRAQAASDGLQDADKLNAVPDGHQEAATRPI